MTSIESSGLGLDSDSEEDEQSLTDMTMTMHPSSNTPSTSDALTEEVYEVKHVGRPKRTKLEVHVPQPGDFPERSAPHFKLNPLGGSSTPGLRIQQIKAEYAEQCAQACVNMCKESVSSNQWPNTQLTIVIRDSLEKRAKANEMMEQHKAKRQKAERIKKQKNEDRTTEINTLRNELSVAMVSAIAGRDAQARIPLGHRAMENKLKEWNPRISDWTAEYVGKLLLMTTTLGMNQKQVRKIIGVIEDGCFDSGV